MSGSALRHRTSHHRNLVVLRAGEVSLHPSWYTDDREFDLVVDAFSKTPRQYLGTCDELFFGLGATGAPAQHRLFTEHPRFLDDYDCIWIPDDDIRASTAEINLLFRVHRELGFDLAQPALTTDSHYTHTVVMQHTGLLARETNFVESMVPIWTSEALRLCLPTLADSPSSWGLDSVWPAILQPLGGHLGVYDCIAVTHTRPVGSTGNQGFDVREAQRRAEALTRAYGVPPSFRPTVLRAWDDDCAPIADADLYERLLRAFPCDLVHEQPVNARAWDAYGREMRRSALRLAALNGGGSL